MLCEHKQIRICQIYVEYFRMLPITNSIKPFFTPQPLRAVRVLFSPMVSGWMGGRADGGVKFVRAVSQKP